MTLSVAFPLRLSFAKLYQLGKRGLGKFVCGAASALLLPTGIETFSLIRWMTRKLRLMFLEISILAGLGMLMALYNSLLSYMPLLDKCFTL